MVAAASASTSRLIKQVGGILLSSPRPAASSSITPAFLALTARHSHVGSAPVDLPPSASIEILPYPPHPNPGRPLLPSLRQAKSVLVKGPKGEVVIPLHDCVELEKADPTTTPTSEDDKASSSSSASSQILVKAKEIQVKKKKQIVRGKKTRGTWGLTRSLLENAVVGVTEGHTLPIHLVGVGYRAALEPDPLPRQTKLDVALASGRAYFFNEEAKKVELEREQKIKEAAEKQGPNMRLNIRLGYSHPVLIPIPYGITAQVPQPNRIVLTGADKEALGRFAAEIRNWRKPEPYKGKGVFVNHEIVRLKTAKKK